MASPDCEGLVGIDHDFEAGADRIAHRGEPRDVLADMGPADLDLGAAKALRAYRQRVIDQRLRLDMEPAAFGGIDRHRGLRAAGFLPQRRPAARHLTSHSAVSIAASARAVMAPTAVACVAKNSDFQIASMSSGSRPSSRGAR